MAPITEAFVANIHHFINARGLDLLSFGKGEDKDAIAHRYLAGFPGRDGVLLVGRAQEKAWVFRTQKRRNPATGKEYLWLTRATLQVNYFYFYCVDDDFGPFFIKFCSYFPYGAKLCINGNHWAQRQAEKAGIGFTPMDNACSAVDDVPALQAICDSLGEQHVRALLDKWLRILPHPFTEDDIAAGYRYDISIVQAEFSLTQMLDKPVTGRIFLDQMIRDNLDLGRPDKISLIFGHRIHNGRKRPTPSEFRTRIVTGNVTPAVRVEYKKTKVKQYHKEGRALRTETVINDPGDFGIGKGLANLPALRQVGFTAYEDMTGGQITYDLRRLRVHGLIERIHPPYPPLPGHRHRTPPRPVPHPPARPVPAPRARRTHRPARARPRTPARRRPRLPQRDRRPRPPGTTSRINRHHPRPGHAYTKFDSIMAAPAAQSP